MNCCVRCPPICSCPLVLRANNVLCCGPAEDQADGVPGDVHPPPGPLLLHRRADRRWRQGANSAPCSLSHVQSAAALSAAWRAEYLVAAAVTASFARAGSAAKTPVSIMLQPVWDKYDKCEHAQVCDMPPLYVLCANMPCQHTPLCCDTLLHCHRPTACRHVPSCCCVLPERRP
jgi:hypothetical protein